MPLYSVGVEDKLNLLVALLENSEPRCNAERRAFDEELSVDLNSEPYAVELLEKREPFSFLCAI